MERGTKKERQVLDYYILLQLFNLSYVE